MSVSLVHLQKGSAMDVGVDVSAAHPHGLVVKKFVGMHSETMTFFFQDAVDPGKGGCLSSTSCRVL